MSVIENLVGSWRIYATTRKMGNPGAIVQPSNSVGTLCEFSEAGIMKVTQPPLSPYELKYTYEPKNHRLILHYKNRTTQQLIVEPVEGSITSLSIGDERGEVDFLELLRK